MGSDQSLHSELSFRSATVSAASIICTIVPARRHAVVLIDADEPTIHSPVPPRASVLISQTQGSREC